MEKTGKPNNLLRQHRELRGWSQERLAEEIGTNHVNISRWETGVTSPSPHYRNQLCNTFGKNAHELGLIEIEVLPDTLPRSWSLLLPHEHYYPLPGREADLLTASMALQDPQGPLITLIDGLGGLGKTALALELAHRLFQQQRFVDVVGESAKQEHFTGSQIIQLPKATLSIDVLIDAMIQQLGRWELLTLEKEKKQTALRSLLQQTPYLILIDNVETAENAEGLVFFLQRFLGTSRAIVTSRKQIRADFVSAHSLHGLGQEDALFFLQHEMQHRQGQHLQDLSEASLIDIYTVTGGAPLALKLVIAQTRFLDLAVVLRRLRQAGSKLYSFIYQQSWAQLSLLAQQLLLYIGQTVATTVGWEELAMVGSELTASEEEVLESLEELCAISLLEISTTSHQKRYGMHQLTRQFVTSELPQLWQEQGLL